MRLDVRAIISNLDTVASDADSWVVVPPQMQARPPPTLRLRVRRFAVSAQLSSFFAVVIKDAFGGISSE